MTSRKKIRFLGLAQIVPLFDGLIFKKSLVSVVSQLVSKCKIRLSKAK